MKIRWIFVLLLAVYGCRNPSPIWQWKLESRSYAEPVLDDKMVYVVSQAGEVVAGDYRTGKIFWKKKMAGPILAAPALTQTSLFTATENGYVYSLNKTTGDAIWKIHLNDTFIAPLSTFSNLVLVPSGTGSLRAISQSTGKIEWEQTGNKKYNARAMVTDSYILIGGWEKKFQCLRLDGTLNWSFQTGGILVEDATVLKNAVFLSARDNHIYSFEIPTGRMRWRFPVKSPTRTILVNNQIVFADDAGILYVLHPENGELIRKIFVRKNISQIYPSQKGCIVIASSAYDIDLKSGDISLMFRWPEPIFKMAITNEILIATDELYSVLGIQRR
jgi:outer membrane protein assembly factor BamB